MDLPDYLKALSQADDETYSRTESALLSMRDEAVPLLEGAIREVSSPMRRHVFLRKRYYKIAPVTVAVFALLLTLLSEKSCGVKDSQPVLTILILTPAIALPVCVFLWIYFEGSFRYNLEPRYKNVTVARLIRAVMLLKIGNKLHLLLEIHTHWSDILVSDPLKDLIVAIVEELQNTDSETYYELAPSLKNEIFKRLEVCSAFLLPASENAPPCGAPRTDYDVTVSVAILQFYARVGDVDRIGYVKRLWDARPAKKYVAAYYVVDEAEITFIKLQSLKPAKETLLRPADKPANPDYLLLPVLAEKKEELLRPSNAPPKDKGR